MPSSYTQNTGIELIANGEQSTTWGTTTNTNFDIIDRAISGVGSIALSGTTSTLSTVDGDETSDGLNRVLVLGGTPSGPHTITVSPNNSQKLYIVQNDSGETVTFTQGSGGNVSVADGTSKIIFCDGAGAAAEVTDVTGSLSFNDITITGGTISGVTLSTSNATITGGSISGTPITTSNATITGGTITGITDLAVADGGTGASTAAGARTNLGVAIGSDVLAYDANLQSFVTTFTLPTTDGAAGQVLSTNGSGTLGFEDQRVAGSTLFTATGAITAGKVVELNSDGTVSQVSSSGGALSLGAYANLTAGTETNFTRTMIYDPDEGVLVVFYADSGDIYGVVGTISSTTITWGTPTSAGLSVTPSTVDAVYDTTRDEFLVLFGVSSVGIQSIQATVSAGSVTFDGGTVTTLSSVGSSSVNGSRGAMVTYDSITNRFVLCGIYTAGAADVLFFTMGVPGASGVTWSAPGVDDGSSWSDPLKPKNKAYNTTNGRSCFTAERGDGVYFAFEIEVDLLSASVTQEGGGQVFPLFGDTLEGGVAYSAVDNKYYLIAWQDASLSSTDVNIFSFISGETWVPGGLGGSGLNFLPVTLATDYGISILYNPSATRLLLFVTENSNAAKVYEQLPGGGFSSATAISSVVRTATFPVFPVMDTSANKLYSLVGDEAAVITPSSAASTAADWVGIAESGIANAATGFVTLLGGINDQQSSLTIGSVFYVDTDGGITTAVTPYGKIGKAISATELLVTEGNA